MATEQTTLLKPYIAKSVNLTDLTAEEAQEAMNISS